jgi:hypothetical protein
MERRKSIPERADRLAAVYAAKARCTRSAMPIMAEPIAQADGQKKEPYIYKKE